MLSRKNPLSPEQPWFHWLRWVSQLHMHTHIHCNTESLQQCHCWVRAHCHLMWNAPQLVVLFLDHCGTLGDGTSQEEVDHWGRCWGVIPHLICPSYEGTVTPPQTFPTKTGCVPSKLWAETIASSLESLPVRCLVSTIRKVTKESTNDLKNLNQYLKQLGSRQGHVRWPKR